MVTNCRLARTTPDARRDHIIAVAAELFAHEGYGATSMSTIATRLGGSKATLYKYFASKEALFEAVMECQCERVLAPLRDLRGSDGDDLEPLLAEFGVLFLTKIYEPGALDVYRLVHSEGTRFPELAKVFFRSGPDAAIEELRATLARFVDAGRIACPDLLLAAGQYLGMLRGDRHLRFAVGGMPAPDDAEIARHARHAARIFVAGVMPRA
ncbi:TetR/AcrR family transcriptional regulator [Novosphingobium sp.]|uniref:TetR/AcrR family transcriptional regulator n=1 Tax=Novosphingobium sp. TaxID=1874826 RepID=UPI003340EC28